jgi:malonyl-CoA O-methyltransferase
MNFYFEIWEKDGISLTKRSYNTVHNPSTIRKNMNIQESFSQNAKAYGEVNIIQKKVLHALIAKINDTPAHILDIGCGRGGVYETITWKTERFVGMDFAEGMLSLHPKADHITLLLQDFNDTQALKRLNTWHFDRIISASALQWADDLDSTLSAIAALNAPVSLAIFTANTFKTLYETAKIPPILRSREEVVSLLEKHFPHADMETLHYTLQFDSVREMFRYMKKSGVGAGRNILGYSAMKQLMQTYPLDSLEYEIILLHEEKRAAQ